MKLLKTIIIATLFICNQSFADEVVKADFENSIRVSGLAGVTSGFVGQAPKYAKGVEGKAIVISNKPKSGAEIYFPEWTVADKGSISFWLCPLDWDYDDGSFQGFISLFLGQPAGRPGTTEKAEEYPYAFCFYKYGNPHMDTGGLGLPWIFYKNGEKEFCCAVDGKKLSAWKRGKWHLVVLSWDKTAAKPYRRISLDGEAVTARIGEFDFTKVPATIRLGALWGGKGTTAIDNLRVWDTSLTEDEQSALYDEGMEKIHAEE